jgi:hypothetical protein
MLPRVFVEGHIAVEYKARAPARRSERPCDFRRNLGQSCRGFALGLTQFARSLLAVLGDSWDSFNRGACRRRTSQDQPLSLNEGRGALISGGRPFANHALVNIKANHALVNQFLRF